MSDAYMAPTGFGIGRIVALSGSVIGRNLQASLLIGAAYAFVSFLGSWVTLSVQPAWLGIAASTMLGLVMGTALVCTLTFVALGDLGGQPLTLAAAAQQSVPLLVPVFLLSFVAGLGVVLGMVLLVVPGILLALRWFVVIPVRLGEGGGLRDALARSAALTKGHRGSLFGLSVLYVVILLVVGGLLVLLAGGFQEFEQITVFNDPALALLQFVLNAVSSVLLVVVSAVAYAELRRVKDGFVPGQLDRVFE